MDAAAVMMNRMSSKLLGVAARLKAPSCSHGRACLPCGICLDHSQYINIVKVWSAAVLKICTGPCP